MKQELAGLCRFFSKNHGEDFVSFDEYIKEMKVGRRCWRSARGRPGARCVCEGPVVTRDVAVVDPTYCDYCYY